MRGRTPWSNRRLVEECRSLSIARLVRDWVIGNNSMQSPYPIRWKNGFEVIAQYKPRSQGEGTLGVVYTLKGERIEDGIEVTSIPSPIAPGRRRYFLKCRGLDGRCGRSAGVVYLPRGETYFACRICHDLAYRTSQEHDKSLDRFRKLPPDVLSRALESADPNTRMLAFRAIMRNRGLV